MATSDGLTLGELERRIATVLPEEYRSSYEDMQPVPMRSAGLKYATNGRVAWDRIWGSFCDLAMAGGPPHKGKLLEPGRRADVEREPDRYDEVAEEICRGVRMTVDIDAEPSPTPGWVRVLCLNEAMAGWLARAITMENVAVRLHAKTIDVPAAPHFRLEKEIKNVITVVAKTCHYWLGHMPREQHHAIAALFASLAAEQPLVEPAFTDDGLRDARQEEAARTAAVEIRRAAGLHADGSRYAGWLGVECSSIAAAIWMMRALVVSNVLARREGTVLFVPINPLIDPTGAAVAAAVARVHRLAAAKGVLAAESSATRSTAAE